MLASSFLNIFHVFDQIRVLIPEVTWAAFVQLDLYDLLLLRRLLTLATFAPAILTGQIL